MEICTFGRSGLRFGSVTVSLPITPAEQYTLNCLSKLLVELSLTLTIPPTSIYSPVGDVSLPIKIELPASWCTTLQRDATPASVDKLVKHRVMDFSSVCLCCTLQEVCIRLT